MNKEKFENWLSEMKRYLADVSVKKYLSVIIPFLDLSAKTIHNNGLLSLEDNFDCPEYINLIKALDKDTGSIKRIINIICMGVFCNDCTGVWENFLLYTVDPSERALCLFIIEGFYAMMDGFSDYNTFKYSFIGMDGEN